MKDIQLVEWSDVHYKGKALKIAAGVQISESLSYTADHGLTVVTGNCPTVGVAGGYIQGGGHSPLSSKYGLAADQTLEFEVIDGHGEYLIANRQENSDLYWALSGGGGGTYSVVMSVTVKTYPDLETTMATLQLSASDVPEKSYWDAIASWNALLPEIYDAGCSVMWGWTREGMRVYPLTCPGASTADVETILTPFLSYLDEINVAYTHEIEFFDKYSVWYDTTWSIMEKSQAGIIQGGSWFIPEHVVKNEVSNHAFLDAGKKIVDVGVILHFLGFRPSRPPGVDNAVFAGWRNLAAACFVAT